VQRQGEKFRRKKKKKKRKALLTVCVILQQQESLIEKTQEKQVSEQSYRVSELFDNFLEKTMSSRESLCAFMNC
jgi:hypothetical protein